MNDMPSLPSTEVAAVFSAAATTALQEMTSLDSFVTPIQTATLPGPFVTASLQLLRPIPSKLTLILRVESAKELANRYLPPRTVITEELVDDVAGEFANVIAGQAKTILKGTPYHFSLSTPEVTHTELCVTAPDTTEGILAIELDSEIGPMLLRIDLSLCPSA